MGEESTESILAYKTHDDVVALREATIVVVA
jgi:hypothetical protein